MRRRSFSLAMELLRQQFGGKCIKCGSRYSRFGRKKRGPLHFAHIKATALSFICTGRGGWKRYYDIKNNPDCYQLMCCHCHREYDNNKFKVKVNEIIGYP